MSIRVIPLGAGQDVGKSCVLVTLANHTVMFDCGMHMGYNDARRFPDFGYISPTPPITTAHISAVVITHFHLDHVGALPYLTGVCGYKGPVYMTHPTKAICPILLEDYRRIHVDKYGQQGFFTQKDINECMQKVIGISLHETVEIVPGLTLKPYYAGHVLGAAMFLITSTTLGHSVVYTGDYNTTPDRHLGAAKINRCQPDLLITESTYATTVRDSKRRRETLLLRRILSCVEAGGKVLIPVFALGRAQELCILLDTTWKRLGLDSIPVYFSAGLTEKANAFYKLFVPWTNENIKREHATGRNPFDFARVKPWAPEYVHRAGAAVLFATPGMLNQGTALEVFKQWAPDPKNLIILPGYCVKNTVGYRVLNAEKDAKISDDGTARIIPIDTYESVLLRARVENLSFSAHADATGIMQLLHMAEPRAVMLVHGERARMEVLKRSIEREFNVPCFMPPNHTSVVVLARRDIPALMPVRRLMSQKAEEIGYNSQMDTDEQSQSDIEVDAFAFSGKITLESSSNHAVADVIPLHMGSWDAMGVQRAFNVVLKYAPRTGCCSTTSDTPWRDEHAFDSIGKQVERAVRGEIKNEFDVSVELDGSEEGEVAMERPATDDGSVSIRKWVVTVKSIRVSEASTSSLMVAWEYADEGLAGRILDALDVALS